VAAATNVGIGAIIVVQKGARDQARGLMNAWRSSEAFAMAQSSNAAAPRTTSQKPNCQWSIETDDAGK